MAVSVLFSLYMYSIPPLKRKDSDDPFLQPVSCRSSPFFISSWTLSTTLRQPAPDEVADENEILNCNGYDL